MRQSSFVKRGQVRFVPSRTRSKIVTPRNSQLKCLPNEGRKEEVGRKEESASVSSRLIVLGKAEGSSAPLLAKVDDDILSRDVASGLLRKPTDRSCRVKVRAANLDRDHSLGRKRAGNGCWPIALLLLLLRRRTRNASGVPLCRAVLLLHARFRQRGSEPSEGDGIDGSDADRLSPGVHRSPMNAGRRPSQGTYRGDTSSSTRKRRHCDGTSPKENFRCASTFRTSSDLSGDHG